jgi:hypothetical protein
VPGTFYLGAFGNAGEWIVDALRRALASYAGAGLDVAIVRYGAPSPKVRGVVGWFPVDPLYCIATCALRRIDRS